MAESPQHSTNLAAHEARGAFASAMRSANVAMVLTDARRTDHPILFANPAFCALTGYPADEVLGRNCRFLQGPETDGEARRRLREAIAGGAAIDVDLLNYRKDGSTFWNALALSPVRDDAGKVAYMLGVQRDVTEHKASEHGLEAAVAHRTAAMDQALRQKSTLLHEVDHRVKNNLQLISSLLLLQSRRVQDEVAAHALRGMLERVNAIAVVHRRLFQNPDIDRFDVAEFVRDLTADLATNSGRPEVRFELDLERVDVPASQAAPAALMINELIGNALKHAFPDGRSGVVELKIRRAGAGFEVEVRDDGRGLPAAEPEVRAFGLTIVHLLARQLRAQVVVEDRQPGTRAIVSFA